MINRINKPNSSTSLLNFKHLVDHTNRIKRNPKKEKTTNKKTVDELDGKIVRILRLCIHSKKTVSETKQAVRELIKEEKDKDRPYIALMEAGIEEQIEEITTRKEQIKAYKEVEDSLQTEIKRLDELVKAKDEALEGIKTRSFKAIDDYDKHNKRFYKGFLAAIGLVAQQALSSTPKIEPGRAELIELVKEAYYHSKASTWQGLGTIGDLERFEKYINLLKQVNEKLRGKK